MKFANLASLATVALLGVTEVQAKCDKNLALTVERCLKDREPYLKVCGSDQVCLCKEQFNIIRCYDVCPDDEEYQGKLKLQLSQVTIQCNSAGVSTSTIFPSVISTSTSAKPQESASKNSTNKSDKATNSATGFNSLQVSGAILLSASVAYALL